MENNPVTPFVQMDSVIESNGSKYLLATHFIVERSLMLAFLSEINTSQSDTAIFNEQNTILGNKVFSHLFQIILADKGSVFQIQK